MMLSLCSGIMTVTEEEMKRNSNSVIADRKQVAKCGLYCAACSRFLKGNCPGCSEKQRAGWCKVRKCTTEKQIPSCGDCDEFSNPMACRKYNNFMAKFFGFLFNSDRGACISRIKEIGPEAFSIEMSKAGMVTIPRRS